MRALFGRAASTLAVALALPTAFVRAQTYSNCNPLTSGKQAD
jgi:hypothetical protein